MYDISQKRCKRDLSTDGGKVGVDIKRTNIFHLSWVYDSITFTFMIYIIRA